MKSLSCPICGKQPVPFDGNTNKLKCPNHEYFVEAKEVKEGINFSMGIAFDIVAIPQEVKPANNGVVLQYIKRT